jgi:hypothetical protein
MEYLDLEVLKEEVPSIFAEKPHNKVSDKYTFIPTTKVIDVLGEQGWHPTKAHQYMSKSNVSSNNFRRHLMRFRNEDFANTMSVGDTVPEIVMFNSHDATSSFRFHIGLFRMVCSNGLVVATDTFGEYRIRHQRYDTNQVITAVNEITGNFPQIYGKMDAMNSKVLSHNDIVEYGKMAVERRWGKERSVDMDGLLQVRRSADKGNELWKVFNRVQENMLKGGIITSRKVDGREIINKTRAIKSIDQNVSINKMLWNLSEEWL